jgi:SAM-dependent methyltransferase
MLESLRYKYVKKIYADHNDSRTVKSALNRIIKELPKDYVGLNIGAGKTKFGPNVKNLEIEPGEGIDYTGSVEDIPCESNIYDLVIAQEVLEHVKSPERAMEEIKRVLKSGGIAYIQLPFIIGYHPCPNDYWRFTDEGIVHLVESSSLVVIDKGISVGPGTGYYRISVEFFSILASSLFSKLYLPFKALFSFLLYPFKWLDLPMYRSPEATRISGGYFVIARKT